MAALLGAVFLRLRESHRFQVVVGLDDLDQPLLGGAVAAIGVRVELFHQRLEANFHLLRGGADIEAEPVERLALGVADLPGLGFRLLLGAQAFAEDLERIGATGERSRRILAELAACASSR